MSVILTKEQVEQFLDYVTDLDHDLWSDGEWYYYDDGDLIHKTEIVQHWLDKTRAQRQIMQTITKSE